MAKVLATVSPFGVPKFCFGIWSWYQHPLTDLYAGLYLLNCEPIKLEDQIDNIALSMLACEAKPWIKA